MDPVVVGISGASGSILAKRAIGTLLEHDVPVIATCTPAARMVWQEEMEESFGSSLAQWQESPNFSYYPIGDLKAPMSPAAPRALPVWS